MPAIEYRLHIYAGKDGLFRWRFIASNGRIVADGGEAYASRSNAIRAARRLKTIAPIARLVG